jgi:hypothetical protein
MDVTMRTTIRRGTNRPRGLTLVRPNLPTQAATAHNDPMPDRTAAASMVGDTSGYDQSVYDGAPWGGALYGGEAVTDGGLDGSAEEIPSRTTVVALSSIDTGLGTEALVVAIAELATQDELAIVYGHVEPAPKRLNPYTFVGALRLALPRYNIVAVLLDPDPSQRTPEYALLRGLLEDGAVSVAAVSVADPAATAAELAEQLRADRVLGLTYDQINGVIPRVLWSRQGEPATTEAA